MAGCVGWKSSNGRWSLRELSKKGKGRRVVKKRGSGIGRKTPAFIWGQECEPGKRCCCLLRFRL
jgi:hypothetical protein